MSVAIVDYRAGNVTSVQRALAHLGHDSVITSDYDTITAAERVIFPGVGAARSCMDALIELGCDRALRQVVAQDTPLLGICVGMQLLFEHSEEDGGVDCLGLIPGQVRRFPTQPGLKIPHMGWNGVRWQDDPLAAGIAADSAFYFVHSYYCQPAAGVETLASSDHGGVFCAGVRHGCVRAVQFHPEKSGPVGLAMLANFLGTSVATA